MDLSVGIVENSDLNIWTQACMVWSHFHGMIPSSDNLAGWWIECVNLSCSLIDNSLPFLINCIARLMCWCPEAWNLKSWHACVQMFKSEFSTIPADKSICWGHTSGDFKKKIFSVLYPPPQIPVGLHMDSRNPPGLHLDSIKKIIQPTILKIYLDSTWTPPGIQVASIWSWSMYSTLCKVRKITTLARGDVTWSKFLMMPWIRTKMIQVYLLNRLHKYVY